MIMLRVYKISSTKGILMKQIGMMLEVKDNE